MQKKGEKIARNEIVNYRLMVVLFEIIHIHTVFIKAMQLILELKLKEFFGIASR